MAKEAAERGQTAEKRYRSLLDRRDHESQLADEARAQRDLLQSRRRELIDEARAARARRDELSQRARQLEERARAFASRLPGAAPPRKRGGKKVDETDADRLARLDAEIASELGDLETNPRPLADEKAAFERVRRKRREADALRVTVKVAGDAMATELGVDVPKEPDALRREVELLRAQVEQLRQQAQTAHEDAMAHSDDIDGLTNEAETFHKRVLEHRERADELHGKAMKMRELVIAERNKRKAEQDEADKAVRDQAGRVRDALYDKERIAAEEEEAVALLRNQKRLTL